MAAVHAQAAPVRRDLLDVGDAQAAGGEDAAHRVERQVGEMLVVDGVELRVLDQAQQMREFQGDGAAGLERGLHALGEIVDVGHVGVHVVAGDQVGLAALVAQAPAQRLAEEFAQHGDAQGLGGGGGAVGRLDAQAGDAGRHEVLQQVAVVGRQPR